MGRSLVAIRALALTCVFGIGGVRDAVAQHASTSWSPLRPIADEPRSLLRAPFAPGLLTGPAPLAGAFMLSGAPGSLVHDLAAGRAIDSSRFGSLLLGIARSSGDFRRPMDFADHNVVQVSGYGWSAAGSRSIVIGRFVLDRDDNDVSSYTARVTPYSSSPIVMTDSVQPPMQTTRVRLEGALGVSVAGFGVGVAGALDSREHNSVDFPLRRSGRAAAPAVALGVERALPWFDLRVGGFYRWSEPNESNRLNPAPLSTLMYSVRGYDEPFGVPVTALTPIFVRNASRASAVGGSLDATVVATRIIVTREHGNRRDEQTTAPFSRIRPIERWRADGKVTTAQVQRRVRGISARVVALTSELDGDGERSDLDGIAFRGRDTRRVIEADVRTRIGERWQAALGGGLAEIRHQRTDFAADLRADIGTRRPFVTAELAREFNRVAIAVGASVSLQAALESQVPDPEEQGPTYNRLIAPGLAYEVAEARASAYWFTAAIPISRLHLVMGIRSERSSPRSVVANLRQPGGDRRTWAADFGVRW